MLIPHFVPNLISPSQKHHLASFIALLILFASSQTVSAQQQITQDAFAIFERSCFVCHGPTGSFRDALLIERNTLIQNGTVVPGNPHTSELYDRLITTDLAKRMPLNQPPLSAQAIDTIRNWILAGAPDWTVTTTPTGDFISHSEVLNDIETHLMSLPSFDRAFARYFTMTHLYNVGESAQILQEYRKGLFKLVNSLSWGVTVTNPQPIDTQGTIFYIDLRHYEWDRNDSWTKIEAEYPYHISFDAPEQIELKEQLGRLQTEMNSNIPSVHIDWFVATASLPPLYHDLLSLPLTDRQLETRLEVDVLRNINNAPGVRVWRAGTNDSGVSANNRMLERHTSRYGAYWKSYDFAGSVGAQNIFTHPLSFTHDGGEVIFNLPNGLQGYLIVTASGLRLDAAPIGIVSNPAASDPTVRTGLSCFGCHIEGMNTFEDQVRPVIESNTNPSYDKAQALRLYVEKSEMDALLQEDIEKYRGALEETGGTFDDIEPIARFHEAFQGSVDAAYAAAVVGLETDAFLDKIRENVGLQNIGLLVLASPNGSMKRDAWTSSFRDIVFALNFPTAVVVPPVVTPPERPPGAVVQIPDSNLHAAIAEALDKSPNAPITVEEMERLSEFDARNRDIQDLMGLQFATNLSELFLNNNQVSDLSPITGLITLRILDLWNNPVSDLSPVKNLKNLYDLTVGTTLVSDLSPVAGLVNLEGLHFYGAPVSDLSPVAGLINLKGLSFSSESLSDLSPVAGLINLRWILTWGSPIADLSPVAGLTNLHYLEVSGAEISDLTPLTGLINLESLHLHVNSISDISPLAALTELTTLGLADNHISDVSPLAGLINLTRLTLHNNKILDISPLDGFGEDTQILWPGNPGFPKGGPKIEGPWLWVALSDTKLERDTDLLSEVSGGTVTEVEIATHGVIEGQSVGQEAWTSYRLPPTGENNIQDMLKRRIPDGVIYGTVSLYLPREQETTMYVGSDDRMKVWLNGTLVYEYLRGGGSDDYSDFFPVTLKQGQNVLLVAVLTHSNAFFGFEPGTEYTVTHPGISYTSSQTPIHAGDTFTLDINAEDIFDLAGWQFDIAFDPAILEAISTTEGDFLKMGSTTLFQSGSIDNVAGKIGGLSAARLSTQGVSGSGTLLQVTFKAKSEGETELALQNVQFGDVTGTIIAAGPHQIRITVEERLPTGDVNRDGVVSILDLILIAQQLGRRVAAGSPVDLNGDGIVSILDLILTARSLGNTTASAAPVALNPDFIGAVETEGIDPAIIEAWIAQARLEDDGSLAFKQGIESLERLLAALIPKETALLHNYPNPFNPETWIPYQLANPAEVTLTIHDMNGQLARRLVMGHQTAGMYRSRSRAIYWDGRNQLGESVASGLYFYTLTVRAETEADDFTATRRMLILK